MLTLQPSLVSSSVLVILGCIPMYYAQHELVLPLSYRLFLAAKKSPWTKLCFRRRAPPNPRLGRPLLVMQESDCQAVAISPAATNTMVMNPF